jgi:hypothetical protein
MADEYVPGEDSWENDPPVHRFRATRQAVPWRLSIRMCGVARTARLAVAQAGCARAGASSPASPPLAAARQASYEGIGQKTKHRTREP